MHPIQETHSQGNWNQYLLVLDKSFDGFEVPMKDPIDYYQTLPLVPEIDNSHAVLVNTCRRFWLLQQFSNCLQNRVGFLGFLDSFPRDV
jgi:hypothetical protein